MVLYELTHLFSGVHGALRYCPKFLGLFDSYENIHHAIELYRQKPGFIDCPNAFSVRCREVVGNPTDNCIYEAIVYLHTTDYHIEHEVELGLFASEKDASSIVDRYCMDNERLQHINNLKIEKIINKCILGAYDWVEGFQFDI